MGTVFNITSFTIMVRKNIRKYACMRYLAFLSLVDLIVLYQWNLNTFFKYNLSVAPEYKDLEEISLIWCRYISFMAFSTLQLSSWILSLVSFDRVRNKNFILNAFYLSVKVFYLQGDDFVLTILEDSYAEARSNQYNAYIDYYNYICNK